jgi:hypothetical protein
VNLFGCGWRPRYESIRLKYSTGFHIPLQFSQPLARLRGQPLPSNSGIFSLKRAAAGALISKAGKPMVPVAVEFYECQMPLLMTVV